MAVAFVRGVSSEASTQVHEPNAEHAHVRARGRRILTLAAAVVIVFGLKFAQPFLVPVVIGLMVAAVSSPLVTWLVRRGAPTVVGAAIVLALDIAVLGVLARLLLLAASDLQDGLPAYVEKFSALNRAFTHYLQQKGLHQMAHTAWFTSDQLSSMLKSFIGSFASGASDAVLVMFVVFFALCEIGGIGDKLRDLHADAELQFERVDRIVRQIQLYMVVKLWTSFLAGAGAFIVLRLAGVELALLIALATVLLHFIPNVGTAISTVVAIVFALADRGAATALSVGIASAVINTLVGSLIEPRMLGTRLGVSPLVLLLGMLFWAWLWGPVGALLSVPILAATKIVLENIPDLAWIGELADNRPRHERSEPRAKRLLRRASVGVGLGATESPRGRRSAQATMPGFSGRAGDSKDGGVSAPRTEGGKA
jgi:AI-2 transport protein TqsA